MKPGENPRFSLFSSIEDEIIKLEEERKSCSSVFSSITRQIAKIQILTSKIPKLKATSDIETLINKARQQQNLRNEETGEISNFFEDCENEMKKFLLQKKDLAKRIDYFCDQQYVQNSQTPTNRKKFPLYLIAVLPAVHSG